MIHPRHVLATLLVAFAALPGCSLDGPVVCGDHADCISCAEDASCEWCGDSCKPLADSCDWPTTQPQACADWPPQACAFDAWGAPCATGICTEGTCAHQINGTRFTTYWRPDGTTQMVCDGEPFVVAAHWDVAGSPRTATATADYASCSFHLPAIRGGPVTVVLQRSGQAPVAVETARSFVDFGFDQAGRPEQALASASTDYALTVSNLEPWTTPGPSNLEDEVQFWTSSGSFWWGNGLSLGTTSATWNFAWQGEPLYSAPAGDYGFVTQLTDRSSGGWVYKVATLSAGFPWIAMADGTDQSGWVTLAGTPTSGTVTFDWRFSDFAAYQSQLAPGSPSLWYDAYVSGNPYTLGAQVMTIPDMLYMEVDVPPGGSLANAVVGPLSFGRFLPSTFYDATLVGLYAAVPKTFPGSSTSHVLAGISRAFAGSGSIVATPLVSPPQSILIAGRGAMSFQSGVGSEPDVSWLPPAIGTPTAYQVSVARLEDSGGSTKFTWVLRMVTESTSLRIPPGVLQPGATYFLRVSAEVGADLVGAPYDSAGFPYASAFAVTADFTP